ncbi:MAG: DNA polymerase III subunit alpha, partial [bacterium]|nr:DNA polymerase III subunit alpha [bacterium]
MVSIARQLSLPLVITNDCHYVEPIDQRAHDILLCIQTGKTVDDPNRLRFVPKFYMAGPEELRERLSYLDADIIEQGLRNTVIIAQQCNVQFSPNGSHLPHFEIPEGFTEHSYLRHLCNERLRWRYGEPDQKVLTRLDFELDILERSGYVGYFLIVQDVTSFAREQGISVGPGRGSAVGSLVAYVLGITDLDPLPYDLLFERFLHLERVSMPDIDIDFCYERREEVINYVTKKYGQDNVCQIITFGTLGAKAAVRDVARTLGVPLREVDKVAKLIPTDVKMKLERAVEKSHELADLYNSDSTVREVIDIAKAIEGVPRHVSVHAAGVVIASEPLINFLPLAKSGKVVITQFEMNRVQGLGLLKMDFLGLRTLTIIRHCIENIKLSKGVDIDFTKMGYEDVKTYEMIAKGDTLGVFQLEGAGMRSFFAKLKPTCFEDVIAGISLFRPGPMDQIPKYLANKEDPTLIKYDDPRLEAILKVTYGCLVYQEQVQRL